MKEIICEEVPAMTLDGLVHATLLKHGQELVRCKDCKHRPTDPENKGLGQSLVFPDDVCPCQIGDNWYCANGERKETT